MTKTRTQPVRTCVGCGSRDAQARLLRVVAVDGRPIPDPRRRLPGRGAYVHYGAECVDRGARRGGFARGLRTAVRRADLGRVYEHVEQSVPTKDDHRS